MIEKKYASPRFGKIPDLDPVVETMLLKLHVITGWAIPQKELMDILMEQFKLKLKESYAEVNADEMLFAFRNSSVKDWGKAMNLNLIDEVMVPYLEKRVEVSRMEEHKKVPALPAAQVSDAEFIESVRSLYKQHQDFRKIPVLAYKCLNLQLTDKKKEAIKTLVNAIMDEPTQDNYKQYAVKVYFDGALEQ